VTARTSRPIQCQPVLRRTGDGLWTFWFASAEASLALHGRREGRQQIGHCPTAGHHAVHRHHTDEFCTLPDGLATQVVVTGLDAQIETRLTPIEGTDRRPGMALREHEAVDARALRQFLPALHDLHPIDLTAAGLDCDCRVHDLPSMKFEVARHHRTAHQDHTKKDRKASPLTLNPLC
jgi:hypothetical protein